jgi:NOL1/NOP2/fmu family ribosome biogenesis protein
MSAGLRKEAFNSLNASYDDALGYLRKDPVKFADVQKGYFLIRYNEVNLGFCNNIGSRINNYYPVGWRIRMPHPGGNANIIKWNDCKPE